jgi:hypothetical protein
MKSDTPGGGAHGWQYLPEEKRWVHTPATAGGAASDLSELRVLVLWLKRAASPALRSAIAEALAAAIDELHVVSLEASLSVVALTSLWAYKIDADPTGVALEAAAAELGLSYDPVANVVTRRRRDAAAPAPAPAVPCYRRFGRRGWRRRFGTGGAG